jgi:hypothetical protein
MSFINNISVAHRGPQSQEVYNSIKDTNRLVVVVNFTGDGNESGIARAKEDKCDISMDGAVFTDTDGTQHPISTRGVLSTIKRFEGNARVAYYDLQGEVKDIDYSNLYGHSLTLHMTEAEIEAINTLMIKAGVKAAELTVDMAPLSCWTKDTPVTIDGKDYYETVYKGFARLSGVVTLALDCTRSTKDPRTVDPNVARMIKEQNVQAKSYARRTSSQGARFNAPVARPQITLDATANQ